MKKINVKSLVITSIVCLLPIILGLIFYNKLPESITIHWGIDNNPNGYFSKPVFVFGMPIMMVALQIFCCIVNGLSDKNPEANKKAVTVYKWIIPILSIVMYVITIIYALGNKLDIRKIVMIILGVMLVVIGNYLPKTKGYRYVKFGKVKDEHLKQKIARASGYMLIIDGILFMISTLFKPSTIIIFIGIIILETIILHIYIHIQNKKKIGGNYEKDYY